MDIFSPLVYCAIAGEPLLHSKAFLKIMIFFEEKLSARLQLCWAPLVRGEKIPLPPWGTEDMAQMQGAHRCSGGQDQSWLLVYLRACVVCFHKGLTVPSRELRIISFNTVPCLHTAVLDICLVCATHIKSTGATQAYSESEVQKEKKEG